MQIVNGGQYTFSFTPSGIDLSGPFSEQGSAVVASLVKAGYPISNPTWTQSGTGLGYLNVADINVSFVYTGQEADSQSLGEAMANELSSDFSTASFTFSVATGGDVAAPGSPTDILNAAKKDLPSPSTVGIVVVVVALLAIAVHAFAASAATRV